MNYLAMSGIELATKVLTYVLVGSLIVCAVVMGLLLFKRLSKKPVTSGVKNRTSSSGIGLCPVSDTVPIDGFFSGMIVQDDGQRFTTGIRTYGFDYFSLDDSTQMSCVKGYRNMILSMDSSVSLYSAYHSFDISKQIAKHEQAREQIRREYVELKEQLRDFDDQCNALPLAERMQHQEEIERSQAYARDKMDSLLKQEAHMMDMIRFLKSYTDEQVEQFQDYAYFLSYQVPYEDAKEPFEVRAENARRELDVRVHNIRSRLGAIGVSAKVMTDDDLQIAVYRHTHPSGRNISDEEILSLLEERRTVGKDGIVRFNQGERA